MESRSPIARVRGEDGGVGHRYFDVQGMRVHCLEAGAGETVVLVHGGLVWCCAEMTYGAVLRPLSRAMHVLAVDLPGYGLTDTRGTRVWTATEQGEFLVTFLRQLQRPVHLAGNSHGGWLVQYVTHEAPEIVRRLVIINSLNGTSWIPTGFSLPLLPPQRPSEAEVRRELAGFYVHQDIVTAERVQRTHDYVVLHYNEAKARQDALGHTPAEWNRNLIYKGSHISEHAGALRAPVLLTWSRENRGASPADAVAFYNRLNTAEMHVFTGAGHHVMTEYPERWTAVVRDFLSSDG
jgi:2-hydroxymuconate-semialdehyde hydrolase